MQQTAQHGSEQHNTMLLLDTLTSDTIFVHPALLPLILLVLI